MRERSVFEILDPVGDAELLRAADARLTYALAAPVQLFGRRSGRVLVAGFSIPPDDLDRAFWVADSYARLVALLVHDADAFGGLLGRARPDGLTGCLTYESVLHELSREINRSARAGLRLSCCFIDLDGRCPRCTLVITPRLTALLPRYCPRCLARRRLAVQLRSLPNAAQHERR